MNRYISIILITLALLFNSCSNPSADTITKTSLSAVEFADKIKELPEATLIDVRTPEEFEKGHIANAVNYDWNNPQFEKQMAALDKSKPVLVYCLSGARSLAAADKMRISGFSEVYEMEGGLIKWRAANLPETGSKIQNITGLTIAEFETLLNSDKPVLVDFYADWCAPCKKMKPYLDEIATKQTDKIKVLRINADENKALCKELKVEALPVLQLYKSKKLTWTHTGFIDKSEVVKQLQ